MDEEARQQIVDEEQLRILRMGYFVAAGITAFASLVGILYAFLGFGMLSRLPQQAGNGPPVEFLGRLVGFIGVGFAVVFLTIAVLQFLAGQCLKARKSRIFCMVIAAFTCLSIPIGTFLGVCTFIVLGRPTVVNLFDDKSLS